LNIRDGTLKAYRLDHLGSSRVNWDTGTIELTSPGLLSLPDTLSLGPGKSLVNNQPGASLWVQQPSAPVFLAGGRLAFTNYSLSNNSFSFTSGTLELAGGTLTTTATADATWSGAARLVIPATRLGPLSVTAGTLAYRPDGTDAAAPVVTSLALSQSASLDLTDNRLLLDHPGPITDNATLPSQLRAHLLNNRILSSTAAAADPLHLHAIAYADAPSIHLTSPRPPPPTTPLPALLSLRESQFGPTYVSQLLTSIPEPSALTCLLPALPLRYRTRRKS
jgi:hypothetical protein